VVRLDEDDVAVAGVDVEGGHALDPVHERIEVVLLDLEDVHRERAGLDIDLAELLRLAQGLVPRGLARDRGGGDQGRSRLAGLRGEAASERDPVLAERLERPRAPSTAGRC